jgi:glycosyltransferase involved in cell wall biosynthesis
VHELFVIEGHDFDAWSSQYERGEVPGRYPYGVELIEEHGFRVRHQRVPDWLKAGRVSRRIVDAIEYRVGYPIAEPLTALARIRTSDICLAMFEDHAAVVAKLRKAGFFQGSRPKLVVVACWLAQHAISGSARTRVTYARRLADVELVICFSANQRMILWQRLGIPLERIAVVPFGADTDFFDPSLATDEEYVFAAGGDRGRDYLTLAAALADGRVPTRVVAWKFTVARIDWPSSVDLKGSVDHLEYRRLLAGASVVVVPNHVLAYPTGQSVLVEAMAMGKACVATDSPALRDYIDHGRNGLLVRAGDEHSLRAAIDRLLASPALRQDLGQAARADVVARFNRRSMWADIAALLAGL